MGNVNVEFESKRHETHGQILNTAIRLRSNAISFDKYKNFLQGALCRNSEEPSSGSEGPCHDKGKTVDAIKKLKEGSQPADDLFKFKGVHAHDLLKSATELFLLLHGCGVRIDIRPDMKKGSAEENENTRDEKQLGKEWKDEQVRLGLKESTEHELFQALSEKVVQYFGAGSRLPYLDRILKNLHLNGTISNIFCPDQNRVVESKVDCPCMIELLWSYWHEEGMLVQTLNAISWRFQNRRIATKDPLANLTLNPLRPLSNLLWGYIQDEQNRLTLQRRAYEYDHEYGLSLIGKAVQPLQTADSRSKFLEAFHNLLNGCMNFYKEENNKMIVPDAFPLLNAIKEVHLLLAEGAHNQFGDLPFQARVEMLMQQWLLARPEIQEFLGRRPMMPYREDWMSAVDAMKSLQGWTDVTIMNFSDLGVFGEQILLSIRYGDWNNINNPEEARNWTLYWKTEIQNYIHSYRVVTGVDLANPVVKGKIDSVKPSIHLNRRLEMQLQGK
jgi:hypothetical protein